MEVAAPTVMGFERDGGLQRTARLAEPICTCLAFQKNVFGGIGV